MSLTTETDLPSGAELRRVREARGLSAAEVGDAVGLDRSTVWRVENERPASPRVRRLLAVALGIPVIRPLGEEER